MGRIIRPMAPRFTHFSPVENAEDSWDMAMSYRTTAGDVTTGSGFLVFDSSRGGILLAGR